MDHVLGLERGHYRNELENLLANPSAGVPVPVATETRRSRIVCIARGERPFRYWWLDPVCKHGPRTHADLQVVTPGCDPV